MDSIADKGLLILLGSGDAQYQNFLLELAGENSNFIFLQGYSDTLSHALYQSGDLFLMPSSFEPCGISQMLAMRAGQPCIVHGVGGLNDTVIDGVSGFVFRGDSDREQGLSLIKRFNDALTLSVEEPKKFSSTAKAAARARFTWASVAEQYLEKLY